jgi:peptidoglycan hydrolase-like protein with peptidoglycan-binding domain
VFDAPTRSAVIAQQRRYGLPGDGVVGPATWRTFIARSR